MAGFHAVNTTTLTTDSSSAAYQHDTTTPTTPRPTQESIPNKPQQLTPDESSPNTPTRNNFGGVSGQRPLPTSSFAASSPAQGIGTSSPSSGVVKRGNSYRSVQSRDSEDVDMDDSDDDQDGSDDESIAGESGRPSKKKKGQRFFCTEFPPCTLSFTRSEHLARHIRKHTGERPFQCHCTRRFSRLDNLRQHAQTVHVNEEIPTGSLAATGTRFQRQVRTDRVRPAGNRSRASTLGSQSSHSRGHSRNLSSSSIGSTASSMSVRDDLRRRPPPLMMATDHPARAKLTIDTFRSPPESPANHDMQYRGYPSQSPGGFSTPTSATLSTGPGSPRFPSALQSPISNMQRPASMWDGRAPRRLSVPSGGHPFQSPQGSHVPVYFSPLASSTASTFSGNSSMFGSPTSSVFSNSREFASRAAQDAEFKRRTWHPESRTNFNSPLGVNPVTYRPTNQPSAFAPNRPMNPGPRLPGIESFDVAQNRPTTPPRRGPSPMQVDSPSRHPGLAGNNERPISGPDDRRGVPEWDMSLHRNLTRLDITSTPPKESPWPNATSGGQGLRRPDQQESGQRPGQVQQPSNVGPVPVRHEQSIPSPEAVGKTPETPRKNKRHGWYHGPLPATRNVAATRTSPEDSSSSEGVPTPSTSSLGEYNPSIVHSNGWVETLAGASVAEETSHQTAGHHGNAYALSSDVGRASGSSANQMEPPKRESDMLRLEALVAAATSEEKATTKAM
ncbi:MAG: hypothetical protein M1817_006672 [Caeruleum heppii]|nr:MAG: hypothetical protein M1817_006672 [Caeruleum heppii]